MIRGSMTIEEYYAATFSMIISILIGAKISENYIIVMITITLIYVITFTLLVYLINRYDN